MNKRSLLVFALFSSFIFSSCYYKPFIADAINKKGFKRFTKKEKTAGDNTNPGRNYRVNRYDWDLAVFPEEEKIEGKMVITFTPTQGQNTFLFDLQKRMKITNFSSSSGTVKIKRKGDLLYIEFENKIPANKKTTLTITYHGKPANILNEGPIQWRTDDQGRPWVSTQTEGIGPQFIMPCNALLRAEPDSCTINITVPRDLIVSANGRLKLIEDNINEGTRIYKHEVTNPINIYNISFNIGHFVKLIKPYTDINGIDREIECLVMDYNEEVANKFYDQAPLIMKQFEEMYGVFPWWRDGCRFIESTFEAMEHQSGIAMGSDYELDWKDYQMTLVHELAHEWWGNNVTAYDYCDVWMHEGLATYAEAMFLEKVYGKDDYDKKIKRFISSVYNKVPIKKQCGVLYNHWGNGENQDIYDKGALMMHSLRMVVDDDELFFNTLKQVQVDFSRQNVTSDQWVKKFNALLNNDYSALFDWYLNKRKPPVLQIYVDKELHQLFYRWEDDIPFYPAGEILINTGNDVVRLVPTTSYQSIDTEGLKSIDFMIEKTIYYVVDTQKKNETNN